MISVKLTGESGVHRMLRNYTAPKMTTRMQTATKAGATVFKAPLKAEARKVSKRMARAVSVRKAKRDRPATVVTFRPKVAFFRHFVIGGTRDHGPRKAGALAFVGKGGFVTTKHVRGVKPNPMVDRVERQYESSSYTAIDRSLTTTEAK